MSKRTNAKADYDVGHGPIVGEQWRTIPNHENYEASDLGRIRRKEHFTKKVNGRIMAKPVLRPARLLQPSKYRGYLQIGFAKRGGPVHRFVALTWLGPRPEGLHINHKDGVKTNNRIENLEYLTPIDNLLHAERLGLRAKGERCSNSILTEENVREIMANPSVSPRVLARKFGCSFSTVNRVRGGYNWTHITGLRRGESYTKTVGARKEATTVTSPSTGKGLTMGWQKGPLPPNTWNWGGVTKIGDKDGGFYFADFCGDHVKLTQTGEIVPANQVAYYNNSLDIPPKSDTEDGIYHTRKDHP